MVNHVWPAEIFCFVSFLPLSSSFLLSSLLPSVCLPLSPLWSPVSLPSLHPLLLKFPNKLNGTMCSVSETMQRNSKKRSSWLPPFLLSPQPCPLPTDHSGQPIGSPSPSSPRSFIHSVASVANIGRGFCMLLQEFCPVYALCAAPCWLISLTSASWASLQVNR